MSPDEAIADYERRTKRSWFDDAAFGRYLAVLAEARVRREKAALVLLRAAEGALLPTLPEPMPAWAHRARRELGPMFERGSGQRSHELNAFAADGAMGSFDATLTALAKARPPEIVARAIGHSQLEAWRREHALPLEGRARRVAERPARHAFFVDVRGWAYGQRRREITPTEVMLLALASELETLDRDFVAGRRRWEQRVRRSRLRMDAENPEWRGDAPRFVEAFMGQIAGLQTTPGRL